VTAPPAVRVLVVDDFEQLRDTLMRGLTQTGFAVVGAASVAEALQLPPESYDVVVSDQRLGDAFGTDLFRVLHDRDPAVASRFILMTGDERDMELPAEVPVLLKPFRIGALVDAVRHLAERQPAAGPGVLGQLE
jgi:DNA-binding NtrC family response regulator